VPLARVAKLGAHCRTPAEPNVLACDITGDLIDSDASLVHATWSRHLPLVTILAFRDHSYGIMFGTRHKTAAR
jgi:hypothetical protein